MNHADIYACLIKGVTALKNARDALSTFLPLPLINEEIASAFFRSQCLDDAML